MHEKVRVGKELHFLKVIQTIAICIFYADLIGGFAHTLYRLVVNWLSQFSIKR